jgi:sugar transferase (PEP-CTERM/EpsH1 system associated)
MHILWLKSDLLLPLDKGGKLRTWHLLRHLAARHAITYVAFAPPDQPDADVAGMREVASQVVTIPRRDAPKGTLAFYAGAAVRLLDPLPYAVGKYRSSRYAATVRQLLKTGAFDLLVSDFLPPAVNLPRRLPCPAVLFTHNVESEIWRRRAEANRAVIPKALYGLQLDRMLRFEERTLRRFDGVLAVSDADSHTLATLYPGAISHPIRVVPTGVDTTFYSPSPSEPLGRRLVFTGSMDWQPNEDAMVFFAREILPLVRAEEPEVTLAIVGRAPTPAVRKLAADPAITVTGRVDDVRPYIREAALYVVPLRIGGGTRLKIFEAMSMGRAVVSTTIGAEGLPVASGRDTIIADDPAAFARAVVMLLRDPQRRRQIESAARALVVERYDWSAAAGALERALIEFASQGRRHKSPVHVPAAVPGRAEPAGAGARHE